MSKDLCYYECKKNFHNTFQISVITKQSKVKLISSKTSYLALQIESCSVSFFAHVDIFHVSIFNQLSCPTEHFLQGTCRHSLTHAYVHTHIHMQSECGEAGTTLRNHAPSPPSVYGLQTKTMLHGSDLKIPDSLYQQHFALPCTRTHTHTDIMHIPLKPPKLQPKSTAGGAQAINTSSSGFPRVILQHFTFFFFWTLLYFTCMQKV